MPLLRSTSSDPDAQSSPLHLPVVLLSSIAAKPRPQRDRRGRPDIALLAPGRGQLANWVQPPLKCSCRVLYVYRDKETQIDEDIDTNVDKHVCVSVNLRTYIHTYIHTQRCIYIYYLSLRISIYISIYIHKYTPLLIYTSVNL